MKLLFLLCIELVFSIAVKAQGIKGHVANTQGKEVPYASVIVKGTTTGVSANKDGDFFLRLPAGNYTIECKSVGYATQEKAVVVAGDVVVNFTLNTVQLTLDEVVVKSNGEDPAYAIIREAIKKRPFYNNQVKASVVERYNKDVISIRKMPARILGKKIPTDSFEEMALDSAGKGIIYLSESISKVFRAEPDKFKMEVLNSRVSGSDNFGLTFPVVISLYTNNVKVFSETLNPRGFVSPIADGAIGFYKFKFLGNFFENGKMIHSIRVTPRRKYEPLFTGTINITDDDWMVHSYDLLLTRTAQLELVDTVVIRQIQIPVTNDIWQPGNQIVDVGFSILGLRLYGSFLNVYSNYDITPNFPKKFFDKVVIKYDTAVTGKQKVWWDSIRPLPLNTEELRNYKIRDSVYKSERDSANTRSMRDSLRKWQGKFKPQYVFIVPGIHRTHYADTSIHDYRWGIEPLMLNTSYNTVEGLNASFIPYYLKKKGESEYVVEPELRYGFYNGHFNPSLNLEWNTRQRKRNAKYMERSWKLSFGKRVNQFNRENPIDPLINMFSTIYYGNNYMKIYENYFGELKYARKWESGLVLGIDARFEDRIPLENSTIYTKHDKDVVNLTPNYPVELMTSNFIRHQAFSIKASVKFQPGQRYIQFPDFKVALSSRYPVFSFSYEKGIKGLFGSDVDFDKWNLRVFGRKNLKLAGAFDYQVVTGGFLNRKVVPVQDYRHFNGNLTRILSSVQGSFQLASYYAHSNIAPVFLEGHVDYHLNGLLTNKIPLFRMLNFFLVTGSNAFYVNNHNNYAEVYVGLENIFKAFRVDWIGGYENGVGTLSRIKVGFGGILSSRVMNLQNGIRTRASLVKITF